uniref:DUF2118 domain-containing protein n=1 Tax=Ignisphaera aggregans TaxID=334771 RepID=A0A7C4BAV7_9CREN
MKVEKEVMSFPVAYVSEEQASSVVRDGGFKEFVNFNSRLCVDLNRLCFSQTDTCENGRIFVEVIYERMPEMVIDVEEGVLKSDIVIHNPATDQVLYVAKNSRVFLVEASGKGIYPLVTEGESVSSNKKIFYVVTNKFEVRAISAGVSGVVIYVGDVVGGYELANKMLCVIVREENVLKLHRCS